ncbi:hypothetical protein HEK616_83280 (plasmid) [Streptomyces nigrescens]|uniref:Uncharacterized protein n=1 Tax=Streptomyces nigrescens TaxID=1920 RepID=A0ABN6RB89_STRNI|nr:hypothetical protein HEK616_83280 [Streptomyces nigrescens]
MGEPRSSDQAADGEDGVGEVEERVAHNSAAFVAHAEAVIKVAMIRLMAARLAGEEIEPRGPIGTEAARRLADDLKNE